MISLDLSLSSWIQDSMLPSVRGNTSPTLRAMGSGTPASVLRLAREAIARHRGQDGRRDHKVGPQKIEIVWVKAGESSNWGGNDCEADESTAKHRGASRKSTEFDARTPQSPYGSANATTESPNLIPLILPCPPAATTTYWRPPTRAL